MIAPNQYEKRIWQNFCSAENMIHYFNNDLLIRKLAHFCWLDFNHSIATEELIKKIVYAPYDKSYQEESVRWARNFFEKDLKIFESGEFADKNFKEFFKLITMHLAWHSDSYSKYERFIRTIKKDADSLLGWSYSEIINKHLYDIYKECDRILPAKDLQRSTGELHEFKEKINFSDSVFIQLDITQHSQWKLLFNPYLKLLAEQSETQFLQTTKNLNDVIVEDIEDFKKALPDVMPDRKQALQELNIVLSRFSGLVDKNMIVELLEQGMINYLASLDYSIRTKVIEKLGFNLPKLFKMLIYEKSKMDFSKKLEAEQENIKEKVFEVRKAYGQELFRLSIESGSEIEEEPLIENEIVFSIVESQECNPKLDDFRKQLKEANHWWQKISKKNRIGNFIELLNDHQLFKKQKIKSTDPDHPFSIIHVENEKDLPQETWFISDLHSDMYALFLIFSYIQNYKKNSRVSIVFMGDIFDRLPWHHEILTYLFWNAFETIKGRTVFDDFCFLSGNHDISLIKGEEKFETIVTPAEYCNFLNSFLENHDHPQIQMGNFVADFFYSVPKALFLPNGLLVSHAGFPAADLFENEIIKDKQDLTKQMACQDFTWLRIADKPRNRINRTTKGFGFGYKNFAQFRENISKLGIDVFAMLRGHDHIIDKKNSAARLEVLKSFDKRIATFNSISCVMPDEYYAGTITRPVVARLLSEQQNQVELHIIDNPFEESIYDFGN